VKEIQSSTVNNVTELHLTNVIKVINSYSATLCQVVNHDAILLVIYFM